MNIKNLLAILLICFSVLACRFDSKITQGNEVAARIEKFRSEKNRVPDSLSEIGIKEDESGPIYYRKESESKYILWFGKELGESVTYDSQTKKWK